MPQEKLLTEDDILFIKSNLDKTASELSRLLDKPRPKIAKILRDCKNINALKTKETIFKNKEHQKFLLENYNKYTCEELANILGYGSQASVRRFLQKHVNLENKKTGPKVDYTFYENYFKINTEKTNNQICFDLNISLKNLYYIKNKLGIENDYKSKQTYIEYYTELFLQKNNINYKKEYKLKNFRYDFYLIDYKIFIECHGDYWHANPIIYKDKILNDVQKNNLERDLLKSKLLKDLNCVLIVLWEYDIKNNMLALDNYFKKEIIDKLPLIAISIE